MRYLLFIFFISVFAVLAKGQVAEDYSTTLLRQRKMMVSQLLSNPKSPLDASSIKNVRFFAPNDTFVFETIFLPLTDSTILNFPTSNGETKEYKPYAKVFFRFGGSMQQLTMYQSVRYQNHPLFGDKLFLPFWDETNSETTYGGGRYLDVSKADLDSGDFRLDFNKAYNPWCAYSDGFSCPVPPASNRLTFEVRAGEQDFAQPIEQ